MSNLFDTIIPVLASDSYKVAHGEQYPNNTKFNFSYLEARGGVYTHTMMFGLQAFLIKLNNMFSKAYFNKNVLRQCHPLLSMHFMGNTHMVDNYLARWKYILDVHKGKLPLRIQALPEGTIIPTGHPVLTVENTDPNCAWLVGWIETIIQRLWYPNVVAINSASIKSVLMHYREMTTGRIDGIDYMLHDFGARSATSEESAEIASAAHLLNFLGTDTLCSFRYINAYYGSDAYPDGFVPGFSVPATEHSTTTSYLRAVDEQTSVIDKKMQGHPPSLDLQRAYERMFLLHAEEFKDKPFGIVSVVIDSEGNPEETARWLCTKYRDEWSKLYPHVRLVLRPDSGDPVASVLSMFRTIETIGGSILNQQNYKEFNLNIGVIQGDGVCESTIYDICEALVKERYSVSKLVFGMGGKLHQSELDRDTQEVAYKLSNIMIENELGELVSYPVKKTTPGKQSKDGRLMVFRNTHGDYVTGTISEPSQGWTEDDLARPFNEAELATACEVASNKLIGAEFTPVLSTVYVNGELERYEPFEIIRKRADQELKALRNVQSVTRTANNNWSLRDPKKLDRRRMNQELQKKNHGI